MSPIRNSFACMLSGLTLSLCLCACNPTHAQTAPPPPATFAPLIQNIVPADLAADTRLDRPCTVHEVGIPLDALLLKVGADVPLSANRSCADLKIHLRLNNRPIRQIMTALAQLLPGEWYKTPDGKGYVLRMSQAAVMRRQRWWNLFLGERQRLWEMMSAHVLQAMQARPEIKGEATSADGNDESHRQRLLAGPTFFNLLPAALQDKVAHSINQTPHFKSGGTMLVTGMEEGGVVIPFTALPAPAQAQMAIRVHAFRPQADMDGSYVLVENVGDHLTVDAVNGDGDLLATGFGMDVNLAAEKSAFSLNHYDLPRKVKQLGRAAPSVWKELAAYQESRVWPNDPPTKPFSSVQNRSAVLEWLGDAAPLEFVADYYTSSGETKPTSLPPHLELPLKQELDQRAGELYMSWKQAGDITLFRKNSWYRDDELEVPAPLLRRWLSQNVRDWVKIGVRRSEVAVSKEEKAAQTRGLLDWQAEVVSTLTPWQIFNGLAYVTVPEEKRGEYAWGIERNSQPYKPVNSHVAYAPFKLQVQDLLMRYRLMLFYASLNADQRTALLTGTLDYGSLTGDQAQQALYFHPLLQIPLSRHVQPILLGLRPRKESFTSYDDSDLQMVVMTPAMQQPSTNSGLPGQETP